jgi:hypothetical protein
LYLVSKNVSQIVWYFGDLKSKFSLVGPTGVNGFYIQVSVRQAALQLLQDALEGSGGGGPTSAYSEALRVVLRVGSADKSSIVRTAAASCLHAFALAGGPGIGNGGLESCSALCVKVVFVKLLSNAVIK